MNKKQGELFTGDLFNFDDTGSENDPARPEAQDSADQPPKTDAPAPGPVQRASREASNDQDERSSLREEQAGTGPLEQSESPEGPPGLPAGSVPPDPLDNAALATGDDGHELTLAPFASHAYLEYAMSVVKGRALPEVSDGQKPVQRRILYAMHEMGLRYDAKSVKSARVVGNVLGKYHPHGDTAAYDAMVRMAQDFNMRYPLVVGQGNFGSRDGDGAAAMRYTEAHLSKISSLLLDEIKEGTVDFVPNYDGAFVEPKVLPARLPFGLLNGASGIAVGMATEIPSHNLNEVAKACELILENEDAGLDEVLKVLPAPDFPTGGQIISRKEDIRSVYETGRGSLRVRARYSFEEMARGQWRLIVSELPPNTSSQAVLSEIENLTNPKIRPGKKTLSLDQQQVKARMLSILDAVRDESGKEHDVRLVFEPKSKNLDRDEFVRELLTSTSMEANVSVNLVFVGLDGKPKQKTLLEILREWAKFRVSTVRRRTQFRLDKALDRIHILEGRRLVYLNLDDVIHIIRNADDPKSALMAAYPLTERQTDDILEIRLRQLAKLEGIKIEAELSELQKEKNRLESLLGDERKLIRLIQKEIMSDAQTFGDARRTLVEEADISKSVKKVADEPVTVIISKMGYVRSRTGHGHDATIMNFRSGDSYLESIECRTVDSIAVVASSGRVYTLSVSDLPNAKGDGAYIGALIDLAQDEKVLAYLQAGENAEVLFGTDRGFGFAAEFKDLLAKTKAGKSFVKLVPGDRLHAPSVIGEGDSYIVCVTSGLRMLAFPQKDLRRLPNGGQGVSLVSLDAGETLIDARSAGEAGVTVFGRGKTGKAREETFKRQKFEKFIGARARKGKPLEIRFIPSGIRALEAAEKPAAQA